MIRFWADLWRLWRTRHDNPVLYYAAPWRRGWVVATFWYVWLGLLALINFEGVFGWPVMSRLAEHRPQDLQGFIVITLSFGSSLAPLSCLLILSRRMGGRENTEALELTLLTRPAVAFGSVYWGVVAGLAYIATSAIAFVMIVRNGLVPLRDVEWEAVVGFAMVLAWQMIILAKIVQRWFSTVRYPWLLLLTVPLEVSWLFALLFYFAMGTMVALAGLNNWGEPAWRATLVGSSVASALILVWSIRAAGFLGGAKLFSAALPEEWQRRSWWGREVAMRALKRAYPDCAARLKLLRSECFRRWWWPVLGVLAVAWVPLARVYFFEDLEQIGPEDILYVMLLMLLPAAVIGTVISILQSRGWVASNPPAVLSGRLWPTAWAYASPVLVGLIAPLAVVMAWPYFSSRPPDASELIPLAAVALAAAIALALVTVLWVAVLLPARGTRLWLMLGLIWSIAVIGGALALPKYESWAWCMIAFVGGTGVFLLLFFASAIFQRLHDSEVLNVTAGQLSTKATPDPHGPIIPDDLRPTARGG